MADMSPVPLQSPEPLAWATMLAALAVRGDLKAHQLRTPPARFGVHGLARPRLSPGPQLAAADNHRSSQERERDRPAPDHTLAILPMGIG